MRFVGEEPIDKVTRQYNLQMKDKLPQYNIMYDEIPRLKSDNNYISASYVRKLLLNKEYNELDKYVPQTTKEYLMKHPNCMRMKVKN